MNVDNFINWGELSRHLSGSRQTVRRNKIPKKHQNTVDKLKKAIKEVLMDSKDTD